MAVHAAPNRHRLNGIIRDVVHSRDNSGLTLVDADKAFAENAARDGQIPGSRYFHEHVHLTFDGDYLLARTFLPTVVTALGLDQAQGQTNQSLRPRPSRQECADALGFTAWDEVDVAATMTKFTAKPPFLDQLDHTERQARAEAAIASRVKSLSPEDLQRCVTTYRAALARRPNDWQIHFNFGNLLNNLGDRASAATEYEAAVRLMPCFLPMRISLCLVYLAGLPSRKTVFRSPAENEMIVTSISVPVLAILCLVPAGIRMVMPVFSATVRPSKL